MRLAILTSALALVVLPVAGELPERLRPRLPEGCIAVYEVNYGDAVHPPSPDWPSFLHLPASEIHDPGLWSEWISYHHMRPRPFRNPDGTRGVEEDIFNGSDWQFGEARQANPGGIFYYLRPGLFEFDQTEYGGSGNPSSPVPSQAHHVRGLWVSVGKAERLAGRVWRVHGQWSLDFARGDPDYLCAAEYDFDESRRLFTRIHVEKALLDANRYDRAATAKAVPLEIRLARVEQWPPQHLAARCREAVEKAVAYLVGRTEEIAEAPWFPSYPIGMRAVVAWAVLAGGGDPEVAGHLLQTPSRSPRGPPTARRFSSWPWTACYPGSRRATVPLPQSWAASAIGDTCAPACRRPWSSS